MRALLVMVLLASAGANAAPVTFKCFDSSGVPTVDLVVDVEKRTMNWGPAARYRIRAVDDAYITAYEDNPSSSVGGEVWVLNRNSGEYLRASVFVGFTEAQVERWKKDRSVTGTLTASTYRGKCNRPLI